MPGVPPPVITDFSQFARLRADARKEDPGAIRKAAQQFEALFLQTLLKAAHSSPMGDDLLGGSSGGGDMYRDMFDQQMAMQMASGKGLGLADVLVRQLQMGQQGATAAATAATPDASIGPDSISAAMPANGNRGQNPISRSPTLTAKSPGAGNWVPTPISTPISSRGVAPVPGQAPLRDAQPVAPADPLEGIKAFSSPDQFIAAIRPHAEAAARELGVPPQVLMAQAALETGWGRHLMRKSEGGAALNLFGIKADKRWDGERVAHATHEFENGQMQRQVAEFRSYSSIGESFADYVRFLKSSPRYAGALQHGGDPARFASGLQKAGYATDPAYAAKLMRLANSPTMQVAMAASDAKPA